MTKFGTSCSLCHQRLDLKNFWENHLWSCWYRSRKLLHYLLIKFASRYRLTGSASFLTHKFSFFAYPAYLPKYQCWARCWSLGTESALYHRYYWERAPLLENGWIRSFLLGRLTAQHLFCRSSGQAASVLNLDDAWSCSTIRRCIPYCLQLRSWSIVILLGLLCFLAIYF